MNQKLKIFFVFLFTCSFLITDLLAEDRPLPWPWPFHCVQEDLSGSWSGRVNSLSVYSSNSDSYYGEYELSISLERDLSFSNSDYKEFEVQVGLSNENEYIEPIYYFFQRASSESSNQYFRFLEISLYDEGGDPIFYSDNAYSNNYKCNQRLVKRLELRFRKPFIQDNYSLYDKVRFYFDMNADNSGISQ